MKEERAGGEYVFSNKAVTGSGVTFFLHLSPAWVNSRARMLLFFCAVFVWICRLRKSPPCVLVIAVGNYSLLKSPRFSAKLPNKTNRTSRNPGIP